MKDVNDNSKNVPMNQLKKQHKVIEFHPETPVKIRKQYR